MRLTLCCAAIVVSWSQLATAQTFPADNQWVVARDHACTTDLHDPFGDTTVAQPARDAGTTTDPAVQVWGDGTYLYFRLRVDANPKPAAWEQYGWGCQIDTNSGDTAYERMVVLNGKDGRVDVWSNTTTSNSPADSAETLLNSYSIATHARSQAVAADWYVDVAAPLSVLGLTATSSIRVVCGANSNANPSLATGNSGDVVNNAAGSTWSAISSCAFSVGCSTFACASGICTSDGTCGECDTVAQCTNPAKPFCSAQHVCVQCLGAANCGDSNACTTDTCNAAGSCVNAAVTNNTPCPDANMCNGTETCQSGVCTPGTTLDCNDNNACTADSCETSTGCAHSAVSDNTPCIDSTVCNGAEACFNGICRPGQPLDCNDHDRCTEDACHPMFGCQTSPVADGTPCLDNSLCNGSERCYSGTCSGAVPLDCDDNNECTAEMCDPIAGCEYTSVADGTICSTGACTRGVCKGPDGGDDEGCGCSGSGHPASALLVVVIFVALRRRR
jgi:uncharacterized protein (TIGR03382 family)